MSPSPPSRVRPLHLPRPGVSEDRPHSPPRSGRRRRRQPSKLKHLGIGVLCVAGGAAILAALMALAERFNTLLLVSQAVANLIKGLSLLATGLLQLVGLLTVAVLALLALLLLVGGFTRMARAIGGALAGAGSRPMAKPLDPGLWG
jgi:hypothetical protein